jgi:hypothetical protein
MAGLEDVGGDVEDALERVGVPAYVVDRQGIIARGSSVGSIPPQRRSWATYEVDT